MNQPKFKFGDKVVRRFCSHKDVYTIGALRRWSNGFTCAKESHVGSFEENYIGHEDDLQLYQEPKKKKLYAYKNCLGNVQFHKEEAEEAKFHFSPLPYFRATEYDIEYP